MKKPLLLLACLTLAGCATKPCLVEEPQQVTTRLNVHILADGSIGEITLAKSSGVEALDNKAFELMKNARAEPAHKDGTPIDSWVIKSFDFEKVPTGKPAQSTQP